MTKQSQDGSGTTEPVEKKFTDGGTPAGVDVVLEASRAAAAAEAPHLSLRAAAIRFPGQRERKGDPSVVGDRLHWKHIEPDAIAGLCSASVTERDVVEWLDRLSFRGASVRSGGRRHSRATTLSALNLVRVSLRVT